MKSAESDDRYRGLFAVLPLVAALAAHFWSLRSSFANFDLHIFITENPLTSDPLGGGLLELIATPKLGYPIPVTVLAFASERAIFDLNPLGFHAVSLALHVAIVFLVAALARRLGATAKLAAALAAVFAVHPLTVEPVAWVVGQKDLLATLLVLAALYVRAGPGVRGGRGGHAPPDLSERSERIRERLRTVFVFVLAALALLSKPSAVCIPVLIVLLDWALGRKLSRGLILYVATAALAAAVIALSIWSHELHTQTGVSRSFTSLSIVEAAWAVWLQVGNILAPTSLVPQYFHPQGTSLFIGAALGVLVVLALFALIARAIRTGDKLTAAGILLCGAAYGPVAGLVPISRGPADSYMYLPLALLAATLGPALGRFAARSPRLSKVLLGATLTAGIGLSAVAHANWGDNLRLWSAVLVRYPDHPVPKVRIAQTFSAQKRHDLALATLEEVERLHSHEYTTHRWYWGDTLVLLGRFQDADSVYTRAARSRSPEALTRYGFFVIIAPSEPTDPELAAAALRHIAPKVLEHERRGRVLARAEGLAVRLGELEIADALRRRRELVAPDFE